MDDELEATIAGCTAAHRRLAATVAALDDEAARRPSRLPGWTVGHVLTHLARNVDSHVRILTAALAGDAVEQYAGGYDERERAIDDGATRSADELRADVLRTIAALEAVWEEMTPAAWRGHRLARGAEWPCRWLPFHRWREVELHHVDLGLGYEPAHWSAEYLGRELPLALATVPSRTSSDDAAAALAWLVGRGEQPPGIELAPWGTEPEHYHRVPSPLATDPRVVTVFRSRLRPTADDYEPTAQRMVELARAMPGFVEIKTFRADDGERVSVVTFASREAHEAWRTHPEHRATQQRGRDEFYDHYLIQVCQVTAERRFPIDHPVWAERALVERWVSAGFTVAEMDELTTHKIFLDEAVAWRQAGMSVGTASEWGRYRLTPSDVTEWSAHGFRARAAYTCKLLGLSPAEAVATYERGEHP